MRLIFTKDIEGDINAQILTGTVTTDFSYNEMINQLIENKEIDDVSFNGLEDDEKSKIEKMLEEISKVFKEEQEDDSNLLSNNEINEL